MQQVEPLGGLVSLLLALLIYSFFRRSPQLLLVQNLMVLEEQAKSPYIGRVLCYLFAKVKNGAMRQRGDIRKLGDNKWQVRVELPKDFNGKRRRKARNITGSRRDAQKALTALLAEVDAGEHGDLKEAPETVGQLIDRWLKNEVEPTVRRSSYLDYTRKANLYVRSHLGDVKLEDLNLRKVEGFRNYLLKLKVRPRKVNAKTAKRKVKASRRSKAARLKTISHTTVKNAMKCLSMALNYGVRHGYVRRNEVNYLKKQQWRKPKKQALTEDQARAFLEKARDNYWYVLFALLIMTGLRPSEALALRWSDLDLDNLWLYVERKLTLYPDGSYEFEDPKTEESKRSVPIPAGLKRLLKHRRRQETLRAYDPDLDLVFGDLEGQPADSRNILNSHVKPIAERAGIDRNVTLYALRHSFVTLSGKKTKASKVTSRIVGHTSVEFTNDVYNHPEDEDLREVTDAMEDLLPEDREVGSEGNADGLSGNDGAKS